MLPRFTTPASPPPNSHANTSPHTDRPALPFGFTVASLAADCPDVIMILAGLR